METILNFLISSGAFNFLRQKISRDTFKTSREALETFILVNKSYRNNFFYANFTENSFYRLTGIRTNAKNIKKFYRFYDKYRFSSWKLICRSQKNLIMEGKEIRIKEAKRNQMKLRKVGEVFIIFFLIAGFLSAITPLFIYGFGSEIIFGVLGLLFCWSLGYLIASWVDPIIATQILQKKTKQLDKKNR